MVSMKYKIDVLAALKSEGYSTYRIRQENLFNSSTVSKFKNNQTDISVKTVERLCNLLNCQPGDIIEYVPDEPPTN